MDRRGRIPGRLELPRDDRVAGVPMSAHLSSHPQRGVRSRRLRAVALATGALVALGGCAWGVAAAVRAWAPAPARTRAPGAGVVRTVPGTRIVSGSFLGDDGRSGYGTGPAPRSLGLVWRFRIGQGWTRRKSDERRVLWSGSGWTGQCTLVEQGGRGWLLLGGYDHRLHKIDASTGVEAWAYEFDDVIKATNTVFVNPRPRGAEDRVIVVSGSRRGADLQVGDPAVTPLRAVSFATGRELWRMRVPRTDNYSQDVDSSPLLVDGELYAPVESGYVYRIDPSSTEASGAFRAPRVLGRSRRLYTPADALRHPDTRGYNVAIEASPARIGRRLYLSTGAGHVVGLGIPDLDVEWDYRVGSDLDGTPVPTRDGRLLVAVERQYIRGPGGVLLLDPAKPPADAVVWFEPTASRGYSEWEGGVVGSVATNERSHPRGDRPRLASFLSVDGDLRVVAIDAMSGRTAVGPDGTTRLPTPVTVFRERVGGSISTPVIVGDTIVACSSENLVALYRIAYTPAADGDASAVAAPDGSLWRIRVTRGARFRTGGPVESTPLVYRDRVYVGCRDGYLYCLGD